MVMLPNTQMLRFILTPSCLFMRLQISAVAMALMIQNNSPKDNGLQMMQPTNTATKIKPVIAR